MTTRDHGEARRLCAIRQQEWIDRFKRIDSGMVATTIAEAITTVDRYLNAEARELGGMDRPVVHELESIALGECWAFNDAGAENKRCHTSPVIDI